MALSRKTTSFFQIWPHHYKRPPLSSKACSLTHIKNPPLSTLIMLTLAIGDLFIPERVIEIPPKFIKLLAPNSGSVPSNPKISLVLCLGNITQSGETLKFLYNLSPTLDIVRGEFDDNIVLAQQLSLLSKTKSPTPLPFYKVVTVDNFRIGFTNGYQIVPRNDPLSLLAFAREINVDILIWGGTHKVEAYTLDGKFFINPGSATGAMSFEWPEKEEEEEDEEEEDEDEKEDEDDEKKPKETQNVSEAAEPEANDDENLEVELTSSIPSFCLLDTQGSKCTLYIYTYMNNEVKVDKVMYQKE